MKTLFVQLRQFAIARAKSPISIALCAAPATLSARRFHSWTRIIFLSHRITLLPNLRKKMSQFGTPPDACSTTNGCGIAGFAPKAKAIVWNGRPLPNTCPQIIEYGIVFGCAVEMLLVFLSLRFGMLCVHNVIPEPQSPCDGACDTLCTYGLAHKPLNLTVQALSGNIMLELSYLVQQTEYFNYHTETALV
jgi:hypothetical protein